MESSEAHAEYNLQRHSTSFSTRMSLDAGGQDDPDTSMLTVSTLRASTTTMDIPTNDAVAGSITKDDLVPGDRSDAERVDVPLYKVKVGAKSEKAAFGDIDFIIRKVRLHDKSHVASGKMLVIRGRNGELWNFRVEKIMALSGYFGRLLRSKKDLTDNTSSTYALGDPEPFLLELLARHINLGTYMENFEGLFIRLTAAENSKEYGLYGAGDSVLYLHVHMYFLGVTFQVSSLKKEALLHVRQLLRHEVSLDSFVRVAKEVYGKQFNETMSEHEDVHIALATHALFYHERWNSFKNKNYLKLFGPDYSFGDYFNKAGLASKMIPRVPHHDDKSAGPVKKRKRTTMSSMLDDDTIMNTPSTVRGGTYPETPTTQGQTPTMAHEDNKNF